ncbi:hypothetical protein PAPYR_10789 [Paratrimastix pyriformis]|uniref:Uncharacterized protein n=1 Tax=Paratrimastix pyriformis TaxID=342808 RepID=A0ABQ8U556_9EUKA|nr:hypothetical protein PAPYR_10789 [Paratrimastix pyriformis]
MVTHRSVTDLADLRVELDQFMLNLPNFVQKEDSICKLTPQNQTGFVLPPPPLVILQVFALPSVGTAQHGPLFLCALADSLLHQLPPFHGPLAGRMPPEGTRVPLRAPPVAEAFLGHAESWARLMCLPRAWDAKLEKWDGGSIPTRLIFFSAHMSHVRSAPRWEIEAVRDPIFSLFGFAVRFPEVLSETTEGQKKWDTHNKKI